MGPLLKTGGLFQQTRAGMYDGDTPELIERTLRGKLRERSIDRPQHELHRIWQQYDKDFDHRVDINEFRQVRLSLFLSHTLTVTCTCCYDEINRIQDLTIYSCAHSLILSDCVSPTPTRRSLYPSIFP